MRIAPRRTIAFYGGKVYSPDNWPASSAYVVKVSRGSGNKAPVLFVDGEGSGLLATYINHSCEPNCQLELYFYNRVPMIAVVSLREINPQEFLSIKYHEDNFEHFDPCCCCGSPKCFDRAKYLAAIKAGKIHRPFMMFGPSFK